MWSTKYGGCNKVRRLSVSLVPPYDPPTSSSMDHVSLYLCVPQPHTYYASKEKQSAVLPAFPDIKVLTLADSISRDKVGGCVCVGGGGGGGGGYVCMHVHP